MDLGGHKHSDPTTLTLVLLLLEHLALPLQTNLLLSSGPRSEKLSTFGHQRGDFSVSSPDTLRPCQGQVPSLRHSAMVRGT